MKKLIIVGAGGFARELVIWIEDINALSPQWEIIGHLSDYSDDLDNVAHSYSIIGSIRDWKPKDDEFFVMAISSPEGKRKIADLMKSKGAKFASIIHPTAILTRFSHYGEGLVMFPHSKLSVNSAVGDFVSILSSGIGHDVKVGDYTTISGLCTIIRDTHIGNDVYIASNVVINEGVSIGDGAYVGCGSVVLKDVPSSCKVFGNPARIVP